VPDVSVCELIGPTVDIKHDSVQTNRNTNYERPSRLVNLDFKKSDWSPSTPKAGRLSHCNKWNQSG